MLLKFWRVPRKRFEILSKKLFCGRSNPAPARPSASGILSEILFLTMIIIIKLSLISLKFWRRSNPAPARPSAAAFSLLCNIFMTKSLYGHICSKVYWKYYISGKYSEMTVSQHIINRPFACQVLLSMATHQHLSLMIMNTFCKCCFTDVMEFHNG